jgi:ribosomal protein L37E
MGRHSVADEDYEDDDDDDDDDDFEAPEAFDRDGGDEDDDVVECRRCGREISAMAEQCPKCGTYVSEEEAPRSSFPKWVIVTAAVLVALMIWGAMRGIL